MTRDKVYSWWTPEQLMYGCERLVSSLHSCGSEPIFFGEAVTDFFIAFCNEGGIDTKYNELDVFEHCYNYAVIEAFDEGFYPMPEMKQMWFRYDKQTDRAYEIEPPVYNKIYKYAL